MSLSWYEFVWVPIESSTVVRYISWISLLLSLIVLLPAAILIGLDVALWLWRAYRTPRPVDNRSTPEINRPEKDLDPDGPDATVSALSPPRTEAARGRNHTRSVPGEW